MTVLNFTFQEASPLITYTGIWTEGTSAVAEESSLSTNTGNMANDPLSSSYNGSFRVTQAPGSSASLTFVGTAISLFGATRPSHGDYTVDIDQQPPFTATGFTNDNEFNKSLWHANDLGYTLHTVKLTNVPISNQPFLDLDFVSIERQIGQPGDNIFQLTVDDTSPSMQFSSGWEPTSGVSSAYQGTLHSTNTTNAQVLFSFRGCSIEVYGQYANAQYTVTLDNQPPANLQGLDVDLAANLQHPQTLLYLADGLSEEINHTVTLTNNQSDRNRPFFLDYVVVSSTHDLNGSISSTPTPGAIGPVANSKHSTPVGAIAGGIIGALVVVALLGISTLLIRRRRRRAETQLDLVDEEPKPYILPTNTAFNADSSEQPQSWNQSLSLVPDPYATSSKLRPTIGPRRTDQSTSSTVPSSSRGRTETSGSSSQAHSDSFTSANKSAAPSHNSASTPRRDTVRQVVNQGEASGSFQEPAVREEDAGAVLLDPPEVPVSLPPAYNPDWDQNRS